jgi:hypothetical protein
MHDFQMEVIVGPEGEVGSLEVRRSHSFEIMKGLR